MKGAVALLADLRLTPTSLADQASLKNPNTSDEKKEEIRAKLKQYVRIQAVLQFIGLLITPCRVNPSQSRLRLPMLLQPLKNHKGHKCPFVHALASLAWFRKFGMFAWMSEFLGRSICYFTSLLVGMVQCKWFDISDLLARLHGGTDAR